MHATFVITHEATGAATTVTDPGDDLVAAKLADGTPFWLDLDATDEQTLQVLGGTFGFHPLAIEDAQHFGQRPKIDTYDEFAFIVVYGITAQGVPVEVHCFYTERFLVTVHRGVVPDIAAAIAHVSRSAPLPAPIALLHRAIDALTDGYFPVLDAAGEAIDALEEAILRRPTDAQLSDLFGLKRTLVVVRRLAAEQRDMVGSILSGNGTLAGSTPDIERYFRDVYDHLVRISQAADSNRDVLSSVLATHLSASSNRMNVVMKQLSIIATVFLPLSFLTGFFGQNFGWMVDRAASPWTFWTVGVGLPVLVAGGLLLMFHRKRWIGRASDQ